MLEIVTSISLKIFTSILRTKGFFSFFFFPNQSQPRGAAAPRASLLSTCTVVSFVKSGWTCWLHSFVVQLTKTIVSLVVTTDF